MTQTQAAPVEAEDESQDFPEETAAVVLEQANEEGTDEQAAPAEITVGDGVTVEQAKAGKTKKAKTPKEPKAPTERKVPESVVRAREERAAIVERTIAMVKITGNGENAKVVMHLVDQEADRTLCGAVVPAGDEPRHTQGWHVEGLSPEVQAKTVNCPTCETRMAKLRSDTPTRKRSSRKPGEAAVGVTVTKTAGDKHVVHLSNAKAAQPRTLCGALIGDADQGWEAEKDKEATCNTCRVKADKLASAATDEESK